MESFCVGATPRHPPYDVADPLPSHRFVLQPILAAAVEARVIGRVRNAEIASILASVSTRNRGHYALDLSKELVRGSERLWNSSTCARGAIVIGCRPETLDLGAIFHYCQGPWIWSNHSQMLKGSPRAALDHAESVARSGLTAFLLSASNGIEWLDVFPVAGSFDAVLAEASQSCRKFKRFVEHNPGATDEMIVDRPPYASVVIVAR